MTRLNAIILSLWLAIAPVYAGSMTLLGAGVASGGGGGPTTTFDPAHTSTDFTLSGGNLIATHAANTNTAFTRSIASHSSSGTYFFSLKMSLSSSNNAVGVMDASQTVGTTNFLGDSVHSVGYFGGTGHVFFNNAQVGAIATYNANDVVDTVVNVATGKVWFRVNGGGWNNDILANQNPAVGSQVGGISISGIGATIFAATDGDLSGGVNTANFGATAYSFAAPSGNSNW